MTHKGFTLVETLVAITVLTVAVAGPFAAIQGALQSSFITRDQLTAAGLAQEGIEYIRARRDNNYLAGAAWLSGINGTGGPNCITSTCRVDPRANTIAVCSGAACTLNFDAANSRYTHQTGLPTSRFTRTVQLTTISANEVRVTSTVTWRTGVVDYTFTLTENIRDWL